MSDEVVMIRVTRRWVPDWLWGIACHWVPLALLLSVHDDDECGCSCHATPGMRDCSFCGWTV